MTNYTTRVEQNFSQTHVALAQAVASRERAWAWSRLPACFGLGWQKEDTHLLALHEPVRHELPRSDPASLVGHVDSLAMLLKALAALRSSTRSLPRSLARSLPCWGKLRSFFFGFLPNASTRDFYSSTPTREPTSISAAAGRNVGVSEMLGFGNVHLEISFGKDPEIFVRFWFPAKISARRRGPQDAKPTLAGPPFGLFPAREKPPPSGVRSFPLKIKCCIHLLPLERPRQRE